MNSSMLIVGTTLSAAISLFTPPVFAQPPIQAHASDVVSSTKTTTHEATLESILAQIERSELVFYNLYNALNSSDEYDVLCVTPTVKVDRKPMQSCEPVLFERIREQNRKEIAQGAMKDVGLIGRLRETLFGPWQLSDEQIRARAAEPIRLMQQEIQTLASENPALRAELETIGRLQQAYIALLEEAKHKDSAFMWQNEPAYRNAQSKGRQGDSPKPWFSAPPAGHTQPQIHFGFRDSPR